MRNSKIGGVLLEQVPPHDVGAEESVIGAMMIESRCAEIAFDELTADDFYMPKHRCLFVELTKIYETHRTLDEVLVVHQLDAVGKLAEIGGRDAIGRIIMATPSAASIESYCHVVRESAIQRRLIIAASKILRDVTEAGSDDGRGMLGKAQSYLDEIWDTVLKLNGEPEELQVLAEAVAAEAMNNPPRKHWGLATGLAEGVIDDLTGGIVPGNLCVLAGRTSMGKSTLVDAICRGVVQMNRDSGQPLLVSTEEWQGAIGRRALASQAGIARQAFMHRDLTDAQKAIVHGVLQDRKLAGVKVAYRPSCTMPQLRALALRHKRAHGLPLLVVDLAGKLKGPGDDLERLSAISAGLAALKGELQTCIVACVQISRQALMNVDKRPDLAFLKGTGAWEEDADKVWFLHRPGYYGTGDTRTEFIQAKDRDGGEVGSVFIEWLPGRGEYIKSAVQE